MKQYLELGKLVNTHGIKGELKLQLWCDDVDYLRQFKTVYLEKNGTLPLNIVNVRPQKNTAIVKFAEISSIDEAEQYKNRVIYGNRDDAVIDENKNYIADLIGCEVLDIDSGKSYGKIQDVLNYGASDIFDVKNGKKHYFIPSIADVVKEIDVENAVVKIEAMKGLFDED